MLTKIHLESKGTSKSDEDILNIDQKHAEYLIIETYKENRIYNSLNHSEYSLIGTCCSLFIVISSIILIFLFYYNIYYVNENKK